MSDEPPKPGPYADLPRDGLLGREHFTAERVRFYAERMAASGRATLMSETARLASRRAALGELAPGADAWVFGYGSLMWNPALKLADSCKTEIAGYHRHFCLTMETGRGTPERPGLMLGLDAQEGVCCIGIAHRIAAADLESESEILWYREMLTGAYQPRWLDARIEGVGAARVLAFVINRDHPRYEGRVAEDDAARRIAVSEGLLGTNRDYLYRTVRHLAELGIMDEPLHRLAAGVRTMTGELQT